MLTASGKEVFLSKTADTLTAIKRNMETVIIGKGDSIDMLLICLLCGGHALIEDVPGVGKTLMASALASSVQNSFQRIQMTPDVLPSDITGYTMINPSSGEKQFYPGVVMNQIVLADELNRTSPKTQSALLQAMQEGAVTVDGTTYQLPRPFMVCATQNPVEQAGTYPLPEAQLDRFLLRIEMGYPSRNEELAILENNKSGAIANPSAVADAGDILEAQAEIEEIICSAPVKSYVVDIARRTREHEDIALGVSPRGTIALMRASMARAMLSGRGYVQPDDVQQMAYPALCHRLVLKTQAYVKDGSAEKALREVLKKTPVPVVSGL